MRLTDTHCHLDLHKFDADRPEVLERAARAGVSRILIPGLTAASSRLAVELARSQPRLYTAAGVHPNEVETWQGGSLAQLKEVAHQPKVVAIGEIGLDYYWDVAPHALQQEVLQRQLDLAAELDLPVVIHLREQGDHSDGPCSQDALHLLEEWANRLEREKSPLRKRPGVLHSFSGSPETARRAIGLHFFIGVTGPITYKNAQTRRDLVAGLPLECLLIETDAPYLTPVPQRGRRNEPAFVSRIADTIAEIHRRSVEEVAAITSDNAARLFHWEEIV
ncbi:MAG: TatD family hydrolase [Anaerolineales bacterium]|nr:TatD family hydrolase [Anaerolineales bacterium]